MACSGYPANSDPPLLVDDGTNAYLHAEGVLAQLETTTGGTPTYSHAAGLGSVRSQTNSNGTYAASADYRAFGLPSRSVSLSGPFGVSDGPREVMPPTGTPGVQRTRPAPRLYARLPAVLFARRLPPGFGPAPGHGC